MSDYEFSDDEFIMEDEEVLFEDEVNEEEITLQENIITSSSQPDELNYNTYSWFTHNAAVQVETITSTSTEESESTHGFSITSYLMQWYTRQRQPSDMVSSSSDVVDFNDRRNPIEVRTEWQLSFEPLQENEVTSSSSSSDTLEEEN